MPFSELIGGDALIAVMEAAPTPLLGVDGTGTIVYLNPVTTETFGYPAEELLGAKIELLVPTDVAETHVRVRESYMAAPTARGMGLGMDLRARRKDGSTFPVEISLTPVPTPRGALVIAGVVDISLRLAAERSVRSLGKAHLAMAELNDAAARATTAEELIEAGRVAFTRIDAATSATVVPMDREPGRSIGGGAVLAPDVETAIARVRLDRRPRFPTPTAVHGRVGVLPIAPEGDLQACLVVESAGDMLDDPSVQTVLGTMAANLSLALERLDQRARLHDVDTQRIELLHSLVTAQEEERIRIAGDVHDDSVQALAALQLRVGLLQQQAESGAPDLTPGFDDLHRELDRVMGSLRTLLFQLEPVDPDSSLRDVVQDVLDRAPMGDVAVRRLEVDWSDLAPEDRTEDLLDLPAELRAQAARILKEALHNVHQHAQASWAQVVLAPGVDGIGISVLDDGIGFPAAASGMRSAPGHRGLSGMRERAELAGGWAQIIRDSGVTSLQCWLPRDASPAGQGQGTGAG